MIKDLNYWKENCAEDYLMTPISVLRYITELENKVEETINSAQCCEELKDKEVISFNEWLRVNNYAKSNEAKYLDENANWFTEKQLLKMYNDIF